MSAERALYIIDEDFEIKYVSKRFSESFPDITVGEPCYTAMWGRSSVCENCPVFSIGREILAYNHERDFLFKADATPVEWRGNDRCFAIGVTPRKKKQNIPYRESNEEIAKFIENAMYENPASGMLVQDCEGDLPITFASSVMLDMMGYSSTEDLICINKNIVQHIHPDDRENATLFVHEELYEGMLYSTTYRLRRSDGSYFWVVDRGQLFQNNDKKYIIVSIITDISELIRVQHTTEQENIALTKHNRLLNYISKYQPGGYHRCKKEEGFPMVEAGDKFYELVGYTKAEVKELFDNKFAPFVHPDDVQELDEKIVKGLKNSGDTVSLNYRVKHKERGYIWVKDSTVLLEYDGEFFYLCTLLDITEEMARDNIITLQKELIIQQKKAQRHKEDLYRHLQLIFALSQDYNTVYHLDFDTGIAENIYMSENTKGNYVLEDVYKRCDTFDERMKLYIDLCVHESDREMTLGALNTEEIRRVLQRSRTSLINFRAYHNGAYAWFQVKMARVDHEDGGYNAIVGFRNIDNQKTKEMEQRKLLSDALIQAQEANKAKTAFLNNMSHDIRTPMNAILGFATLAAKNIDDKERASSCIEKIVSSSNHLLSLINDVLDMSRIEAGKISIREEEESIGALVNTAADMMAGDVQNKRIRFRLTTDGIIHDSVMCDKLRVSQVIINVLSNAVKFTPLGGRIEMKVHELARPSAEYSSYVFEISDTGMGMSEEFVKHVFEPFAREKNTTTSGIQGTGLGMAITKSIVDLLGGDISVKSELGAGTTVTILIPMRPANREGATNFARNKHASEHAHTFQMTAKSINGKLSGKRILVAEDNILNQEITEEILTEAGARVELAEHGRAALELLSQKDAGYYDIVLMDIQMPVMDGYEATKAIRVLADKQKAAIPIVAVTANAFEEERQAAFAAGMNAHVAKPINIGKLIEIIDSLTT